MFTSSSITQVTILLVDKAQVEVSTAVCVSRQLNRNGLVNAFKWAKCLFVNAVDIVIHSVNGWVLNLRLRVHIC